MQRPEYPLYLCKLIDHFCFYKKNKTYVMKKGKIILGIVSFIITVFSAFTSKHNNRHKLFISFAQFPGGPTQCILCNAWTLAGVGKHTYNGCVTSAGGHMLLIPVGVRYHTLYTQKTVGGKCWVGTIRYTLMN